MLVLPAIDIKDGTCVRLYKGDYSTAHKVAESAVETAKKFEDIGAHFMHMVDLDGAKDGKRVNSDLILEVRKNCPKIKIEVGGGIRAMDSVLLQSKTPILYVKLLKNIRHKSLSALTHSTAKFPRRAGQTHPKSATLSSPNRWRTSAFSISSLPIYPRTVCCRVLTSQCLTS